MFDELLAIGEAAKRLGVSQDTLRNWEEQGKLVPERTAGGHRRYRLSDLRLVKAKEVNREAYAAEFQRLLDDPSSPPKLKHLIRTHLQSFDDTLNSLINDIEQAQEAARREISVARILPLGIAPIDSALGGGVRNGWLGLITGPACSFKSTLAQQVAVNLATAGRRVILFSLEMTRAAGLERLVAQAAGTPITDAAAALSDSAVQETMTALEQNLLVLENPADPDDEERSLLTVNWIRAIVQAAIVERFDGQPVDLVVIDGLQHLHPDYPTRADHGAIVVEELFSSTKALDCATIVTSSFKKPSRSFPEGSHAALDFCDFVLTLDRDGLQVGVNLWKNRYGPNVGAWMINDNQQLRLRADYAYVSPADKHFEQLCSILARAAELNRSGETENARVLLSSALSQVGPLVPEKFRTLEHGDKLVRESFKRGHDNPLTLPRRTADSPDFYPEWRWDELDREYRIVDGDDVASA